MVISKPDFDTILTPNLGEMQTYSVTVTEQGGITREIIGDRSFEGSPLPMNAFGDDFGGAPVQNEDHVILHILCSHLKLIRIL